MRREGPPLNERVTVRDVSTYDVEELSEYHSGGTIATTYPTYGSWRLPRLRLTLLL